tara:strand:- start:557 stop:763 length:207 start_codon:yes stop_codon:yes gene_type:complete
MYELNVSDYRVKVFLCNDGDWRHDTVFIYNDTKVIAQKEIRAIIQYLHEEGFIKDKRTKYYIAERNSD